MINENVTPISRRLTELEKEFIMMKKDFDHRVCMKEKEIMGIELKVQETLGEVKHIKNRLDNGIVVMLKEISDKITDFSPDIRDNKDWIKRTKDAVVFISVISVGGGIVSFFWYLIKSGFKK